MNYQIQQLADQAGARNIPEEFLERFAGLIIERCIQACTAEGQSYEILSAGEYQSGLYIAAIKNHFGVLDD